VNWIFSWVADKVNNKLGADTHQGFSKIYTESCHTTERLILRQNHTVAGFSVNTSSIGLDWYKIRDMIGKMEENKTTCRGVDKKRGLQDIRWVGKQAFGNERMEWYGMRAFALRL